MQLISTNFIKNVINGWFVEQYSAMSDIGVLLVEYGLLLFANTNFIRIHTLDVHGTISLSIERHRQTIRKVLLLLVEEARFRFDTKSMQGT